uniref:Uncharacterized protein n=1 Tax=Heterorhabditis bacteriophora TaxID=37862 RepID=A0A1I7WJJ9_HETBA
MDFPYFIFIYMLIYKYFINLLETCHKCIINICSHSFLQISSFMHTYIRLKKWLPLHNLSFCYIKCLWCMIYSMYRLIMNYCILSFPFKLNIIFFFHYLLLIHSYYSITD